MDSQSYSALDSAHYGAANEESHELMRKTIQ